MGKASDSAVVGGVKAQGGTADEAPTDQAEKSEGTESPAEDVEHPLNIISEIEHLLRIVGNVAVHEFRRISERLADLKNHPAIKSGE